MRGGYNVMPGGRPDGRINVLPAPSRLILPLSSRRFAFTDVCVRDGGQVRIGEVIARDPVHDNTPLLASAQGAVRLGLVDGHVVIEVTGDAAGDLPSTLGAPEPMRRLVEGGAWTSFADARTGAPCDPEAPPDAVIVSTMALEPFLARGDIQIERAFDDFLGGLQAIQSLLEFQTIHLAVPDVDVPLAREIRSKLRGRAAIEVLSAPRVYPFDHPALLARRAGLRRDALVWATDVGGVLAAHRTMNEQLPCTRRVVAVGGPGVGSPTHFDVPVGYPQEEVLRAADVRGKVRVINGGALTGRTVSPGRRGIDVECAGLTVLPDETTRELLAFMRAGADRRSFSHAFLSALKSPFRERVTTALRGETRPCVSCGFCREVCPAGILPDLIHKLLHHDALEEIEDCRADLCVSCGLCSYVCPSKIELRSQIETAKERIAHELEGSAAPAGKEAAP